MAPAWKLGDIPRDVLEGMCQEAGMTDGTFGLREYVRDGAPPDAFALCVVYKGKCTHHSVVKNDDGFYTVNKKQYGECSTVEDLVSYLSNPKVLQGTPKWPVILRNPVGSPEWMHGPMANDKAAELLSGCDDGTFLARPRGPLHPNDYVISVVYKGKPTHHQVSKDDTDTIVIQKKPRDGYHSINHLLLTLRLPQPPWWPVSLTTPIPPNDRTGVSDVSSNMPSNWLHPRMSNSEANVLLLRDTDEDGKGISGTFFVRIHDEGRFALSVVYKGKATHHAIIPGTPFTVNKKPLGNTDTLEGLIAYLATPGIQGWPVTLKIPVLYEGADPRSAAAVEALERQAEAAAVERADAEAEAEAVRIAAEKEQEAAATAAAEEEAEAQRLFEIARIEKQAAKERAAEESRLAEERQEAEKMRIAEQERIALAEQQSIAKLRAQEESAKDSERQRTQELALLEKVRVQNEQELAKKAATIVTTGEQIAVDEGRKPTSEISELTPDQLRRRGSVSKALSSLSRQASSQKVVEANSALMSKNKSVRDIVRGHEGRTSPDRSRPGSIYSNADSQNEPVVDLDPYLRVYEILHIEVGNETAFITTEDLKLAMPLLRQDLPTLFAALDAHIDGSNDSINAEEIMEFLGAREGQIEVFEFVKRAKAVVAGYDEHENGEIIKEANEVLSGASKKLSIRAIDPNSVDFSKPSRIDSLKIQKPQPIEVEPMWYHTKLSRDDAQDLMKTFEAQEGDFLVRDRDASKHEYALVVVYKGRATHHGLKQSDEGTFLVNNSPCPATSLKGAIQHFSSEVPGWPVVLKRGIGPFGPIDEEVLEIDRHAEKRDIQLRNESEKHRASIRQLRQQISAEEVRTVNNIKRSTEKVMESDLDSQLGKAQDIAAKASAQSNRVQQLLDATLKALAAVSLVELDLNNPSYLWVECTMRQSRELLSGKADGHYLYRQHPDEINSYLLDVIFMGEFTTHKVQKVSSGYLLNDSLLEDCDTLDDVTFHLQSRREGWPATLQSPVRDSRKCQPRIAGHGSGEQNPQYPSYVWDLDVLPRLAAERLLARTPAGTFVVRANDASGLSFLLGIMHSGEFTQHTIHAPSPNTAYLVNGKPMGGYRTLDDLVEYLRIPRPNWPVKLTSAVRPSGVDAPTSPLMDQSTVEELRGNCSMLRIQLAERTYLHKIAIKRVEDIASLGPDEIYTPAEDVKDELYRLDIECAKLTVSNLEQALQEKEDALSEIRHYDAIGSALPGGAIEQNPNNPSYLWRGRSKVDITGILDGHIDGTYLAMADEADSEVNECMLAVIFEGDVTFHSVTLNSVGVFLVNGKQMGGKQTIDALVKFLSRSDVTSRTGWPIVLSNPLRNPMQPKPDSEALRFAAADVARVESDLEDARVELFALTSRATEAGTTVRVSESNTDPRQVVPGKLKRLIAKLENIVAEEYKKLCGTTLPILSEEHADILLQVVQTKVSEMMKEETSTNYLSDTYMQLFNLDFRAQQARSARLHLRQLSSMTDPTIEDPGAEHSATVLAERLDAIGQLIDMAKKDYKSLAETLGKLGQDPPAQQLTTISNKIQLVQTYLDNKQLEVSEMHAINQETQLATYFTSCFECTSSVLKRMSQITKRRNKGGIGKPKSALNKVDGIECSLGFVPIPAFGSDAVAYKLFMADSFSDTNKLVETASDFARILTIRYTEQIRMLLPIEAARFGRWMVKPVLGALVYPVKKPIDIVVPIASLRALRIKQTQSETAPHRIAQPPRGSGLQIGDSLVKINGEDVTKTTTLSVQKKIAVLKTSSTQATAETVKVSVARNVDFEIYTGQADISSKTAQYFVRIVDGWDDGFEAEVFEDEGSGKASQLQSMHANAFNEALRSDLLGGSLWLNLQHKQCSPADLIRRCGLEAYTGTGKQYFSTDTTDVETFGYRVSVQSAASLYTSIEEELREFRWNAAYNTRYRHDEDPPVSLFMQMEEDPTSITRPTSTGSTSNSYHRSISQATDRPPSTGTMRSLWTPGSAQQVDDLEDLANEKSQEAEALRLEMLKLQKQMALIQADNERLTHQLTSNQAPHTVTFTSSLHTGSRA